MPDTAEKGDAPQIFTLPGEPRVPVVNVEDMQGWTGNDVADLQWQASMRRPDGQGEQTGKFAQERLKGLLIDALHDHAGLGSDSVIVSNGMTHFSSLQFTVTFKGRRKEGEVGEHVKTLDAATPEHWAFKPDTQQTMKAEINVRSGLLESAAAMEEPSAPSTEALVHQAYTAREMAKLWLSRAELSEEMLNERDDAHEVKNKLLEKLAFDCVRAELLKVWPDAKTEANLILKNAHVNAKAETPYVEVQCEVISRGGEDYTGAIIDHWNRYKEDQGWPGAEQQADKQVKFFVPLSVLS